MAYLPEQTSDSEFTDDLLTDFWGSVFNHFNGLTGGGGGNRTRVRRSSAQRVYMLIPSFISRPKATPSERVPFRPARLVFRLVSNGSGNSAILLCPPHPPSQEKAVRRWPYAASAYS